MLENLSELVKFLNQSKVPYCVIGGIAVLLYGGRASTIDFDLYILTSDEARFLQLLQQIGVRFQRAGQHQIKGKFKNIPLDILIVDPWVGELALRRAKKLGWENSQSELPHQKMLLS